MSSSGTLETITCKAAVCWGPGEPMTVEEIEVEPPQASEIRLRMLCSSLCRSDILGWEGFPFALFPRVLGHEGVGIVESVGEGVTEIKEGDVVIPTTIGECRNCMNCNLDSTNLCLKYPLRSNGLMPDGTYRMSVKGRPLFHFSNCSTFSQYTVTDASYVVKVDQRVSPVHASLVSCGFSTGYGAVWKEAQVKNGSTVAVFGLGGVGMGAIVGARVMGASEIIGVDLNEKKKDIAEAYGMTRFIKPSKVYKPVPEVIREMTGGFGVDYSFECSGVGPLVNEAVQSTKTGSGVTIIVGASKEKSVAIDVVQFLAAKTVKGTIFGGIKPQSDIPTIITKCVNEEVQLDGFVTQEVFLEDINHAFELLKSSDCLKVLIQMETTSM